MVSQVQQVDILQVVVAVEVCIAHQRQVLVALVVVEMEQVDLQELLDNQVQV
jgi:hypothetical protein